MTHLADQPGKTFVAIVDDDCRIATAIFRAITGGLTGIAGEIARLAEVVKITEEDRSITVMIPPEDRELLGIASACEKYADVIISASPVEKVFFSTGNIVDRVKVAPTSSSVH